MNNVKTQANVLAFPTPSQRNRALADDEQRKATVVPLSASSQSQWDLLPSCLTGHSLTLHYQPQVDLQTGLIKGYETLLRVRDDQGQACNTADVISQVEQAQQIDQLGALILSRACREFSELRRQGLTEGRLAVNLSPLELRNPAYVSTVIQALTETGLSYEDLELEITESWSLDDPSLHLGQLRELAELGVCLTVDDFGAGHAAWAHVLKLPISTVKIDRSLITDIAQDRNVYVVVKSICDACRELGLAVVAEGVNSVQQVQRLRELGCTLGQGFGLHRPMPGAALVGLMPLTFAC